jgi:predicted O-linked N-acetylglucosamine transferase (SPINDLY family)
MTSMTLQSALELATQRHREGKLREAESIYRQILMNDPRQTDALQGLGLLAYQVGQKEAALKLIEEAISIEPQVARYHGHRGMVLAAMGRSQDALDALRHSLALQRDIAEVHNNLGNVLHMLGKQEEAIAAFGEALAIRPDYPDAHNNLGNVLLMRGQTREAIDAYRKATILRPEFVEAHSNLGGALRLAGEIEEAIKSCRRAIDLQPTYAPAYVNLGFALRLSAQNNEAETAYRKALELSPDLIEAHNGLGNVLLQEQRGDEAIAVYKEAIRIRPQQPQTHHNLGVALTQLGNTDEAITAFEKAISLRPDYAEAMNNLGVALQMAERIEESMEMYRRALAARPNYVDALNNLGTIHKALGRIDEAIAMYDQALRISPGDGKANENRLFALQYSERYGSAAILEECEAWSRRIAEPLGRNVPRPANLPDPDRRLRIGYVSPDFRDHCQSLFTIPLLSRHDRSRFEIFCYADASRPDAVTHRLQGYADAWRSTVGLVDEAVARQVREDQIDILVDLTMHMAAGRPMVFARKPAPVQVAWLAYPGTTGMKQMDYRLTDPYLDPPGMNDAFYTEKSVRLPETFWCYAPLEENLEVNALPAASAGHVTFGCLNNFCKVSDSTLALWACVLREVKNSQLILLCPAGAHRREVLRKLNVAENRVEFMAFLPRVEYLKMYHRIDICLDTLPYNGHTTSLDSFWMGVPVITLLGKTVAGRAGWCQLCNLNLKELANRSEEQFVNTAAALAADMPRLAALREGLRAKMAASPLMDAERFARNMETAYREMWRRWCADRLTGRHDR